MNSFHHHRQQSYRLLKASHSKLRLIFISELCAAAAKMVFLETHFFVYLSILIKIKCDLGHLLLLAWLRLFIIL